MALINVAAREIHCKIVYYGPGMGGKTSNLQYIHTQVPKDAKGDLLSIATETERTLFFDFLPLDLGRVRGFHVLFGGAEGSLAGVCGKTSWATGTINSVDDASLSMGRKDRDSTIVWLVDAT